jgi:hypothetical protein
MATRKPKIGDKVEVTWKDAAGEIKTNREEVDNVSPKELLITNKTYGIFHKEDDEAILIIQEDSVTDIDYTVIPKGWPLKIKILK